MQVAEERGCHIETVVLSQLEEVGDITGMPVKFYKLIDPQGQEVEMAESVVPTLLNSGYTICPNCEPVTSFAKPAWVPEDRGQEFILLLDDFSRCNKTFLQAIMQLLQFGSYGTWKLPKYATILLSSNPEDGMYDVTEIDPALRSRMMNFVVDFDIKLWAKWAESKNKNGQLINFALWNQKMFQTANHSINARNYSMFIDALTGIKLDTKNMPEIILMAQGIFGEELSIAEDLRMFIDQQLDKLPTPNDVITKSWDELEPLLTDILYKNGDYRTDIGFLLTVRFSNYLEEYFKNNKEKKKGEKIEKRLVELLTAKKPLLQENGLLEIVKTLITKFAAKCPTLVANPIIASKLLN